METKKLSEIQTNAGFNKKVSIKLKRGCNSHSYVLFLENFQQFFSKLCNIFVAKDDILDALVAALTAKRGYKLGLKAIPEIPEYDSKGLPMRMVYSQTRKIRESNRNRINPTSLQPVRASHLPSTSRSLPNSLISQPANCS